MKRGFTLLELIVVVIIIGILVSLAVPAYLRGVERARAAEGVSIIGSLRSAEIRYRAGRDPESWTATEDQLDLGFTTKKFFTVVNLGVDNTTLVRVQRNSGGPLGQYNLTIDVNGNIACAGGGTACAQLGY